MTDAQESLPYTIRALTWQSAGAFLTLKRTIESEAPHLVVGAGERKETSLHMMARMLITRNRVHTFLAYAGRRPVGYLTIVMPRFKKLRGNGYLALAVLANQRSQGIGTSLMQFAERFGKEKNLRRMELEVFGKNQRAIALYERLGYEIEGRRRRAVDTANGFDDMVFMAKFIA